MKIEKRIPIPRKQNSSNYHGMRGTPIYEKWKNMKARCLYPSNADYYLYGGRGVTVCEEWRRSFKAFYDYVGDPPGKGYSLDRIDNEGNYEPGNVRWATGSEQSLNRRVRKDNKSGVSGVQYRRTQNAWRVKFRGRCLGQRADFFEAVCLRKSAEAGHAKNLKKAGLT